MKNSELRKIIREQIKQIMKNNGDTSLSTQTSVLTQEGICCKDFVSQKRINTNEENKCPKGSVQINCPK